MGDGNGVVRNLPVAEANSHALLLYRPLYGTRDAPMRWYTKLSATLIKFKFFPLRNDCCAFARFRPLKKGEKGYTSTASKTIVSLAVIHVDDILFAGLPSELDALKCRLRSFVHGEWKYLHEDSPLTFCGVSLILSPFRTVELSQVDYYPKIAPLVKSELISKNDFLLSHAKLQLKLRGFIGACLWITQTRFDIGFSLGLLSSLLPDALRKVESLKMFCALASKTYSRIINQHVPLRYKPFYRLLLRIVSRNYFVSLMHRWLLAKALHLWRHVLLFLACLLIVMEW